VMLKIPRHSERSEESSLGSFDPGRSAATQRGDATVSPKNLESTVTFHSR
jgi:hypothetical protein